MSRTPSAALGRVLSLLSIVTSVLVAGCGGGGSGGAPADDPGPTPVSGTVSGTAAMGAPIAGALVTLKDSANRAVTATTAASGGFTVDTSGLTPPFLLQLPLPGGQRLFSVSTDASRTATINITPLTDVVVRSWYGVQGRVADDAFADPAGVPPPAPAQVRSIAQVLASSLQLPIDASGAPIADPVDLIAKPFAANGTGIDRLLDNTRVTVRNGGADLVLAAGSATQTTAVNYTPSTGGMTVASTTVNGTRTSSTQSSDIIPVQAAQLAALEQIAARLNAAAATINAKGASLAVADLEPFFDASLLDEGRNRSQMLAETVQDLRLGVTVSMAVERLRLLDLAAGKALVSVRMTVSFNGQTESERDDFEVVRGADGQWRISGDGRVAQVSLQAEARRNQGRFTEGSGPSINVDVRAPKGTVSAVTVGDGGQNTILATRGATEVLPTGLQLDTFFANTGPITGTLPAAGTPLTFTLQTAASGTVTYTLPLNAFTTELIQITSPTGTVVPAGALTVTWTLPTTYAVQRTELHALVYTGDQTQPTSEQCSTEDAVVSPTATSGTLVIPSTCNNKPVVEVNLNLATEGANGERSMVVYQMILQR
jgi:hypothetical protein